MANQKKKWTREECRRRYVEGEKISFRTLSQESGRTLSLLGRWSKGDGWVEEREQYQNKLRTKTVAKTIEKTSDRLSEELAKRNEDHVKGYEVFRAIDPGEYQLLNVEASEEGHYYIEIEGIEGQWFIFSGHCQPVLRTGFPP